MITKKLMIFSLILGLSLTGLFAKEAEFEAAKKPELTLKKSDLAVIEKAKSKNFKGLNTKEKELLIKYLSDYAISAKHEKTEPKPKPRPGKSKKKSSRK